MEGKRKVGGGSGWRDEKRDSQRERDGGRRGGSCAAVFWPLSKGSVASSEQTKYWSQLNVTFPPFVLRPSLRWWKRVLAPHRPAGGHPRWSVALITRGSGSAPPVLITSRGGFSLFRRHTSLCHSVPSPATISVLRRNEQKFPPRRSPVLVYHA